MDPALTPLPSTPLPSTPPPPVPVHTRPLSAPHSRATSAARSHARAASEASTPEPRAVHAAHDQPPAAHPDLPPAQPAPYGPAPPALLVQTAGEQPGDGVYAAPPEATHAWRAPSPRAPSPGHAAGTRAAHAGAAGAAAQPPLPISQSPPPVFQQPLPESQSPLPQPQPPLPQSPLPASSQSPPSVSQSPLPAFQSPLLASQSPVPASQSPSQSPLSASQSPLPTPHAQAAPPHAYLAPASRPPSTPQSQSPSSSASTPSAPHAPAVPVYAHPLPDAHSPPLSVLPPDSAGPTTAPSSVYPLTPHSAPARAPQARRPSRALPDLPPASPSAQFQQQHQGSDARIQFRANGRANGSRSGHANGSESGQPGPSGSGGEPNNAGYGSAQATPSLSRRPTAPYAALAAPPRPDLRRGASAYGAEAERLSMPARALSVNGDPRLGRRAAYARGASFGERMSGGGFAWEDPEGLARAAEDAVAGAFRDADGAVDGAVRDVDAAAMGVVRDVEGRARGMARDVDGLAQDAAAGLARDINGLARDAAAHAAREASGLTRNAVQRGMERVFDFIVPHFTGNGTAPMTSPASYGYGGVDGKESLSTMAREKLLAERLEPTLKHAREQRDACLVKVHWTGLLLNICIGLQVLLGAITTGVAAATTGRASQIGVTVLGGLSTLAASYLARTRGSGEPEASAERCRDLENFIRECEAFVLDRGHVFGSELDREVNRYRARFEEILGNEAEPPKAQARAGGGSDTHEPRAGAERHV